MPAATPSTARPSAAAPRGASTESAAAQITTPAGASLTSSSKNQSSWSLRGWLRARFSGVPFTDEPASVIPKTQGPAHPTRGRVGLPFTRA